MNGEQYNWTSFCGTEKFTFWDKSLRNFGICFQKLVLQCIAFFLLSILSMYYFGKSSPHVIRSPSQKIIIYIRMILVLALLITAVLVPCLLPSYDDEKLPWVDVLGSVSEVIGWSVHLLYLKELCSRVSRGTRGQKSIQLAWLVTFVYHICYARSVWAFSIVNEEDTSLTKFLKIMAGTQLSLQVLYLCTLFPKGIKSTRYGDQSRRDERTPLLDTNLNHFNRFQEILDPYLLGVGEERVNWLSYLSFYWVNQMMEKGSQGRLETVSDIYELPLSLKTEPLSKMIHNEIMLHEFQHNMFDEGEENNQRANLLEEGESTRKKYYLFRALYKSFSKKFYMIGFLKLLGDLLGFAGPLLLHELVAFVQGDEMSPWRGYTAGVGIVIANIAGMLLNTHYNYQVAKLNIQIRGSVITSVFRKVQHVSQATLSKMSHGEVVNLLSTDADRVSKFSESFHAFWSMPLQLVITLFLLYNEIGVAFLAGILIIAVVLPLNKIIAKKIGIYSKEMMHFKDKRVNLMTEVLGMIKATKLNAWEGLFKKKIIEERKKEVTALSGIKYLDALCVYLWATTPVLIPIAAFCTYAALGNEMNPARVFTAVALFNMLIMPLNAFPWVITGVVEAWISANRIEKLMRQEESDISDYYTVVPNMEDDDVPLFIEKASFSWNTDREESPLKDVNLQIRKRNFVGIVGKVGSGKSTMLSAILGEIEKCEGIVAISSLHQGFGLSTQIPWLQNISIKENILFGQSLDEEKYRKVVEVCCLEVDLLKLPLKDETRCGENGSSLSGGQKARVALARAVYQNKDIYIFDDVLSAVDEPVAKHIVHYCFHEYLADKTVLLVTHHCHLLNRADWVIVLDEGKLIKQGPPQETLQGLIRDEELQAEWWRSVVPDRSSGAVPKRNNSDINEYTFKVNEEYLNQVESEETEARAFGELTFNVYMTYLAPIGTALCCFIFFSILLMQASRNITDIWLAKWVSETSEPANNTYLFAAHNTSSEWTDFIGMKPMIEMPPTVAHTKYPFIGPMWNGYYKLQNLNFVSGFDPATKFYLIIYALLAATNTLFAFIRSFSFAYGGISAARELHNKLLESVLYAKMVFFDLNPLGRILNRFSSDTNAIDNDLPFQMNIFFAQIFGLLGSVFITMYGVPWILLLYIPLVFLYYTMQHYYRHTSRDLRRIYALTLSPFYNHITETVKGLVVVRALRCSHRFGVLAENLLDENQRALYCLQVVSQWLNIRLQFIGTLVLAGVTGLSLLQNHKEGIAPGIIGLVISYALTINGFLNGVVTSLTETERELISVERTHQYLEGTPRERRSSKSGPPLALPYGWPNSGSLSFDNVYFKYHDHNPFALKGISFDVRSGEKIGIMGRTGAGKTSILMSLFRIGELFRGRIVVDNVDISEISIKKLRTSLAIVSQDILLYSGSIRENLDPRSDSTDDQILEVVKSCYLDSVVSDIGGLDAQMRLGGEDLSSGQRQLFCLARALLSKAKIVCIDEGTSLLDNKTDAQIQTVIREKFKDRTLLIIAHRLHTIRDCDRIIVMKNGDVEKISSPFDLLERVDD